MTYSTYILKSKKTGAYYIGSTEDMAARLMTHNAARVSSTRSSIPWDIMYTESFPTRSQAMTRERQLKSWKSRAAMFNRKSRILDSPWRIGSG